MFLQEPFCFFPGGKERHHLGGIGRLILMQRELQAPYSILRKLKKTKPPTQSVLCTEFMNSLGNPAAAVYSCQYVLSLTAWHVLSSQFHRSLLLRQFYWRTVWLPSGPGGDEFVVKQATSAIRVIKWLRCGLITTEVWRQSAPLCSILHSLPDKSSLGLILLPYIGLIFLS